MSKEKIRLLELDRYEYNYLVNALVCYYNQLVAENKNFDPVVELLDKTMKAPYKKSRLKYALEKCQEKI